MKFFLDYVVRSLVDHAEEVDIEEIDSPRRVVYNIRIHPSDIGKLIGRNGRTIGSIRSVATSANTTGKRIEIEVLEDYSKVVES